MTSYKKVKSVVLSLLVLSIHITSPKYYTSFTTSNTSTIMSGFIRDAEQAFEGGNNNQQDSSFGNQGGNFDNSNQGGFDSGNQGGFDNGNQGGNFDSSKQGGNFDSNNNSNKSGGGFENTLKTGGEDAMLNSGMLPLHSISPAMAS